jgi:hypothetical protein
MREETLNAIAHPAEPQRSMIEHGGISRAQWCPLPAELWQTLGEQSAVFS